MWEDRYGWELCRDSAPHPREGVGGAEMGAHFCEFFFRIFLYYNYSEMSAFSLALISYESSWLCILGLNLVYSDKYMPLRRELT